MKKIILVTGTPGTGKTSIAKLIAWHFDYEYILIGEHKEYISDVVSGIKIIDVDKLIKWLENKQKNSDKVLVVDSHLSHHYPKELTGICFVLRCDPQERRRVWAYRKRAAV